MSFKEYLQNQKYYWYDLEEFISVKINGFEFNYDLVYIINDNTLYELFKKIIINYDIDFVELPNNMLCFDSCSPKYLKYLSQYQHKLRHRDILKYEYKTYFR